MAIAATAGDAKRQKQQDDNDYRENGQNKFFQKLADISFHDFGLIHQRGQPDIGREKLCRFDKLPLHFFSEIDNVVSFMHLYRQQQRIAPVDERPGG